MFFFAISATHAGLMHRLQESVELPLTHPELYEEMGIKPPKGVILYGVPGTGKTLLAKAVANQTSATFLRVVGSELIQKYLGDGPKLVREVFRVAEEHAPSIVFIDEIDAIGTKRWVAFLFFQWSTKLTKLVKIRLYLRWRTRNPANNVGASQPIGRLRLARRREGAHGDEQDRVSGTRAHPSWADRQENRVPAARRKDQATHLQAAHVANAAERGRRLGRVHHGEG